MKAFIIDYDYEPYDGDCFLVIAINKESAIELLHRDSQNKQPSEMRPRYKWDRDKITVQEISLNLDNSHTEESLTRIASWEG